MYATTFHELTSLVVLRRPPNHGRNAKCKQPETNAEHPIQHFHCTIIRSQGEYNNAALPFLELRYACVSHPSIHIQLLLFLLVQVGSGTQRRHGNTTQIVLLVKRPIARDRLVLGEKLHARLAIKIQISPHAALVAGE